MNIVRITCPDSKLPREIRISKIVESFEKWLSVEEFVELVHVFGGNINEDSTTVEKIKWLKEEFVEVWNYRKKQREAMTKEGEAARWLLTNDDLVEKNRDLIYKTAERVGLIGLGESIYQEADYILPLGGARMSNLRRCEIAKREIQRLRSCKNVVALSGMRPIADSERNGYVDTYAPLAKTEYDAICAGMTSAFDNITDCDEDRYDADNPNLSYAVRRFWTLEKEGYDLYAVAAPSTEPTRRSNSADCFKFFFEKFNVPKYSRIINCTSQIYCSYQQVRALFFAVDYDVEFDTIGFPFVFNNAMINEKSQQLSEPVNYLQEMKATVDAMYDFIQRYVLE